MIVDAHHHFLDPARADYPWLTDELAAIRRAFGPDDLAPLLDAAGIDATVLVQTRQDLDETQEFLAIADGSPFVRGVVGWVDLRDAGVDETIAGLRRGPGGDRLVAVRHQVHDEPDPDWLGRDDVRRGIAAIGRAGLAYDLLVRARELPAARRLVAALPDVRFVIDHLAKPAIRNGSDPGWSAAVGGFRDVPNVWWKLSGLVTEADWQDWRPADLQPFADRVLQVAGPDRLLFGSDWPVCLLAAPYDVVVATARTLIESLSPAERAAVLGETAVAVYGLGVDPSARPR
ncbi:MAG TPA: amidohydrolase family protein [Candidatus Acidoferrum sp.]|nr:amidohydrolase family protein [Candidatus Acidoferrum sp.]